MPKFNLWQLLWQHSGKPAPRTAELSAVEVEIDLGECGAQEDEKSGKPAYQIPTVRFNPACWTKTVKADMRKNIKALKDIAPEKIDVIYEAALSAFRNGFDLHRFCQALMANGISKKRSTEIALNLFSKANALISAERTEKLGIKYALWRYSGAPCGEHDAAHKAADGRPFLLSKGMLINGQWTLPGREDGCKCLARPLVPFGRAWDECKAKKFIE